PDLAIGAVVDPVAVRLERGLEGRRRVGVLGALIGGRHVIVDDGALLLRLVRRVRIKRSGWPLLGSREAATQQHHRQQRKPFHRSLSGSDGHVGTLIQWSRKDRNSSGYLKDASLPRRASTSARAASASAVRAGGGATSASRV